MPHRRSRRGRRRPSGSASAAGPPLRTPAGARVAAGPACLSLSPRFHLGQAPPGVSSIRHVTFCKICGYAQNCPGRRASPRGRRREKDAGTALRTGRRLRARRRAAREAGEGPCGLIGRPPSSPGPPCRLPAVAGRAAGGDPGFEAHGPCGPPQGPPAQAHGRRRLAGRVERPPRPHGYAAQHGGLAGVDQQRLDGQALRRGRRDAGDHGGSIAESGSLVVLACRGHASSAEPAGFLPHYLPAARRECRVLRCSRPFRRVSLRGIIADCVAPPWGRSRGGACFRHEVGTTGKDGYEAVRWPTM